jgi:predicted enzyme related to lactoylglutathione lyase
MRAPANPVVHIELHTGNLPRACAFYEQLCRWRPEQVEAGCGSYLALEMGDGIGGGVVECQTKRPMWLPYVEVPEIIDVTERARRLGASVLLNAREGPAGWRSVVTTPDGGEIAFWQPKASTCSAMTSASDTRGA